MRIPVGQTRRTAQRKRQCPVIDAISHRNRRFRPELARDLEAELSTYLRDPLVTVIVTGFVGTFREQIRVLGEATSPRALLYNDSMTLLDVMIQTGGLTDFADGNNSTLVRVVDGNQEEYRLRLDDLVRDGDISANVDMRPGDVIIVPEAWF